MESYKSMLLVPGENGSFYVFKQLNYGTEPDSVLFCLINASWFQQFLSQRFADSLGSLEIISDGEVVFSMTQEGGDRTSGSVSSWIPTCTSGPIPSPSSRRKRPLPARG